MKRLYTFIIFLVLPFSYLTAQKTTLDDFQKQATEFSQTQSYQKANAALRQANQILVHTQNWEALANNLISMAINLQLNAQHQAAVEQIQGALDTINKYWNTPTEVLGLAHHKFGVIYYLQLDYPKAIPHYEKAIEIRQKIYPADHPDLARSYYNLAVSYSFDGAYGAAVDYFEAAINIHKAGSNKFVLAQTYQQAGNNYRLLGDYEKALAYQELSLKSLIELFGAKDAEVAFTYYDMGHLFSSMNENEKAKAVFQKALNIYQERGDQARAANVLHALSGISYDQGDYEQTLLLSQQALEIHQTVFGTTHLSTAKDHNHLGLAYYKMKNYQAAITAFNKALDIRIEHYQAQYKKHPDIAIVYDNLGRVYTEQGNYAEALRIYQLALSHFVPSFEKINTPKNPSVQAILNSNEKPHLLTTLSDKASMFQQQYDEDNSNLAALENALSNYQLCSQLIDRMRQEYTATGSKLFWISKTKPIFEKAIATCVELYQITKDQNYLNQAFEFSEKSKASLLVEKRKEVLAKGFANLPNVILQKEKKHREKIVDLYDRLYESEVLAEVKHSWKDSLLEANRAYQFFIEQLENDYPKYHKLKYDTEVISLSEVQKELLEPSAAMIDFFYGEKEIFIFLIRPNTVSILKKEITPRIEKNIAAFYASINDPKAIVESTQLNFQTFTESAAYIYQYLLADLLDGSTSIDQLVFIRDGLLNFIPFECLLNASTKTNDFLTLPYLIKDYTINYAYSATMFRENRRQASKQMTNRNLLAFAPDYLGSDLNLTGAIEEVETIAPLYSFSKVLQNRAATKSLFKEIAMDYGIIHLALHAKSNDENSQHSKLLFADTDGTKESALLSYELSALDLEAWLVVLSACETGVGKLVDGEGVMSLAWGFMDAGAANVVMSLWATNDQSSRQLMTDFHTHLSEHSHVSRAMQYAKLAYLENPVDPVGHPYYWAGFITTGASEVAGTSSAKSAWSRRLLWITLLLLAVLPIYFFVKKEVHPAPVPKLEN